MLKKIGLAYRNIKEDTSVQNNMILMVMYRIIVTIIPLLTTPYISRILLRESIGDYSYTQSICAYFSSFSALGVSIYAQREIAIFKNNKIKYSKIFWEIFIFRLIMTFIICCMYLYMVINYFDPKLKIYFYIQLLDLFGGLLDISWFFFGLEKFFIVIKKNILLKFITVSGIFLLVKSSKDIYIYVLINSIALVISGLVFWKELYDLIIYIPIKNIGLKKHLFPMITLFFPAITETLYNKLDITMLGFLARNPAETACYEQTIKIATISITTISAVGSVIAPRIAYIFVNSNKKELKKYFLRGFDALSIIGIPICFGMYAISSTLIPWFLGDQYIKVVVLLQIIAVFCFLNSGSRYIGIQYLVTTKRQTCYTLIILFGLFINIFCNYLLIPLFESVGAIIASLISELFILIIEIYIIRNEIKISEILCIMPKKIISGSFMCICVKLFSSVPLNLTVKVICQIMLGILIYGTMLLIFKDPLAIGILRKIPVNKDIYCK